MSWEEGDYSARSPTNITTPQRTPTLAAFGDELFSSLGIDNKLLESSNSETWTPVCAETLGRFTSSQTSFQPAFSTLPVVHSGHKRQLSSEETLRRDRIGPIEGGRIQREETATGYAGLLSPSTIRSPVLGGLAEPGQRTPRKASKGVEATFTGQTATPPASRHKHARRASLVDASSKMQNEQDFYTQSGGMDGGYDLSFATPTNIDMFSFPISGPATAPAYMNGKSFWDPSNGMTDMSMDFADPFVASGDWAGGDVFQQQQHATPQLQQNSAQAARKQRPLLAKPPTSSMPPVQSGVTFDFGMASLGEDPFIMSATSGAVNPNHLFSLPNLSPPLQSNAFNAASVRGNSQIDIQPQPTLLSPLAIPRSQSAHSGRPDSSHRPMLRPVSPLLRSRSAAHRSDIVTLKNPPALKPAATLSNDAQPPSNFAGKGRYSSGTGSGSNPSGRLSPTKQSSRANLQAIPESREKLFNPRTAVTFSIDSNGRARTETTVIMETHSDARPRSSTSRPSAEIESPISGSSTDEEAIVIPSRNPSFMLKDRGRVSNTNANAGMPKIARFETAKAYPRAGTRRLSAGNVKAVSKQVLGDESDEEDMASRSGDAARALRRVVESRRRSVSGITSMPPANGGATIRIMSKGGGKDRGRRLSLYRERERRETLYEASTPSSMGDLDVDVEMLGVDTPSTVASESMRCVCHRKEKSDDEFMIQCQSCECWQHSTCVKIDPRELPNVYVCAFCAQMPGVMGRGRERERERDVVVLDRESPVGRYR